MNTAYTHTLLKVDLTRRSHEILTVDPTVETALIGGKGLGAWLLARQVTQGTDPLGPENPLIFAVGPLTGTLAPAMRGCVVTKSPLTGIFLDSYFGGSFSPEIKYAGFDAIVITGRAKWPVYLWIDDQKVEIREASHLWGMDTLQANHAIKAQLNDPTVKIAGIGPAGESQVPFALIGCEYNRQAGRGGAGAVMGSKNLKAIALRGSRTVKVHDPKAFQAACDRAYAELAQSPDIAGLREAGTAGSVEYASETGLLPHKNYQYGSWDKAHRLSEKGQSKHLWMGSSACMGCPIRCSKMGAVRTGKYRGMVTDIVEYESAALMGANLDIGDVKAVAHLVRLCDLLGLDSMSSGSAIGFAMEACERGLIDAPDGVDLKFGNVKAAEYLIQAMARKSDGLGALLAQGVKKAAADIGRGAQDFAQHTKGLETPAWGPRGVSGMGLAYMTTDRGGCHQRGFAVAYEHGGEYEGLPLDPLTPDNKAALVAGLQNHSAGTDALVKCDFGAFGISIETYARLFTAATGRTVTAQDILTTGERIWNLIRCFNLEMGLDASQDTLPRRFVQEPLPDGPTPGHCITRADMDRMRQEYYALRGWDSRGIPTPQTLTRLGLPLPAQAPKDHRHEPNP